MTRNSDSETPPSRSTVRAADAEREGSNVDDVADDDAEQQAEQKVRQDEPGALDTSCASILPSARHARIANSVFSTDCDVIGSAVVVRRRRRRRPSLTPVGASRGA